ncbi:MAG: hypothetical protein COV33_00525 [Candidatus Zambryskibacteria bacterium CG10_big_fil_rev_8_21_14_0_10_34_34]|uniref:Uncharacterized protein n=1 Tax=Candidatus Zambryskibacteria bacterium CG10_big_fil_rev_8_21_14_0_10_34_34 TaxID=1975114 RepID=A0A2H0R184_9BACT|nr:MAG: hypothetical protein COV33_00525 [Candidatus Zambryskibacteria bacterium CG10_big_fil_rev_8_21_14_0_10_34_34]
MSRKLLEYLSHTDIDPKVRAKNLKDYSGQLNNGQFIIEAEKLVKELTRGRDDEEWRKKLEFMVASREQLMENL